MKLQWIKYFIVTLIILSMTTPTFAASEEEAQEKSESYNQDLSEEEVKAIKAKGRVPNSVDESITAFVKDQKDIISILIGNLNPKDHGGIYADGDDYYIKVINEEKVTRLIEDIKYYTPEEYWGIFDSIHFDEDVKYSLEQLRTASDDLMDAYFERKIDFYSVAIDQMNNGIEIEVTDDTSTTTEGAMKYAADLSESTSTTTSGAIEFANELSGITGLDIEDINIEHIAIGEEGTETPIPTAKVENKFNLDTGTYGAYIENITTLGPKGEYGGFTLGSGIYYEIEGKSGGREGWLTAGHNCSVGDKFILQNYSMGAVDFINLGLGYYSDRYSVADIAVIQKDKNSNLGFSLSFYDRQEMANKLVGAPCYLLDNEEVYLLGQRKEGKIKGKVLKAEYTIPNWDGQGPGDYRYMVKANIASIGTDSGGPLLKRLANGHYAVGGFLKGREDEDGGETSVYTSWRSVESDLKWIDSNGKKCNVQVWQYP